MPAIFIPASTVAHPEVVPYISITDYMNAPTSVDTSSLIPGATAQANLVELANVVRRASAWANSLCYQILAATLDVQTENEVRVRRDGTVKVVNDFWPTLEVDSFSIGQLPSLLTAITDTADMTMQGRNVLVVPIATLVGVVTPTYYGRIRPGDHVYCQWSYWNGWLHSTLAAAVLAGATSVTVSTTLPQAAAGQSLTIWDGQMTEIVTVASSFAGGTVLPLAAPTVYPHALPVAPSSTTITALPDDVREATISLTSALIKTRGAESYEMAAVGQDPSKSDLIEGGGMEDLSVATDLLSVYRRVV